MNLNSSTFRMEKMCEVFKKLLHPAPEPEKIFTLPSYSLPSQYRSLLPARESDIHELMKLEKSNKRIRATVLALSALLVVILVGLVSLVVTTQFYYAGETHSHTLHLTEQKAFVAQVNILNKAETYDMEGRFYQTQGGVTLGAARCLNNLCLKFAAFKFSATCEAGWCRCGSEHYQEKSCLPRHGKCSIRLLPHDIAPAPLQVSYKGQRQSVYVCFTQRQPGVGDPVIPGRVTYTSAGTQLAGAGTKLSNQSNRVPKTFASTKGKPSGSTVRAGSRVAHLPSRTGESDHSHGSTVKASSDEEGAEVKTASSLHGLGTRFTDGELVDERKAPSLSLTSSLSLPESGIATKTSLDVAVTGPSLKAEQTDRLIEPSNYLGDKNARKGGVDHSAEVTTKALKTHTSPKQKYIFTEESVRTEEQDRQSVHVISVSGGSGTNVTVFSSRGLQRVILVLVSYANRRWNLEVDCSLTVEKVVLVSNHGISRTSFSFTKKQKHSTAAHSSPGIPPAQDGGPCARDKKHDSPLVPPVSRILLRTGYGDDRINGDTPQLLKSITEIIGDIHSFVGVTKADVVNLDLGLV